MDGSDGCNLLSTTLVYYSSNSATLDFTDKTSSYIWKVLFSPMSYDK